MGVPRATRFSTTMALAAAYAAITHATREREFLEIVADGHGDHVSEIIEEDARRRADSRRSRNRKTLGLPVNKA